MSDPRHSDSPPSDEGISLPAAVDETYAAAHEAEAEEPPRRMRRPNYRLHLYLFLATCATTLFSGGILPFLDGYLGEKGFWPSLTTGLLDGLLYALPLMTILVCHEMGHYVMARRYGVYASLPFFIPMIPPLGTMGAVIAMDSRMHNRRELFDIGIAGPLAGLIPTLIFCALGLSWSKARNAPEGELYGLFYNTPLVFDWIAGLMLPMGENTVLVVHPTAMAGWVGLLITSLNLIPIGQLDGGHILYALLRDKARTVSFALLLGLTGAIVAARLWHWSIMIVLLALLGPHPPTANDHIPLGRGRAILGWLMLAFIPLGFTPRPFEERRPPDRVEQQDEPQDEADQHPAPPTVARAAAALPLRG